MLNSTAKKTRSQLWAENLVYRIPSSTRSLLFRSAGGSIVIPSDVRLATPILACEENRSPSAASSAHIYTTSQDKLKTKMNNNNYLSTIEIICSIVSLSLPLVFLQTLLLLPSTMTTYALGNSSNPLPLLSAFSLSNMTLNVTSVMVVVGSMTALDTLLPVKFKSDPGSMPKLCSTTLLHTTLLLVPLLSTWFLPKPLSVTSLLALLSVPSGIISLIIPFLRRYALAVPPLVLHQVRVCCEYPGYSLFLVAHTTLTPLLPAANTTLTAINTRNRC